MIVVFGEYFDKIGPTKPKIGNGLKKMDVPAELSNSHHSTSASETSTASASTIDGPIYYQSPPPPPPSPYMCYWNNVRRQKPISENNDEWKLRNWEWTGPGWHDWRWTCCTAGTATSKKTEPTVLQSPEQP